MTTTREVADLYRKATGMDGGTPDGALFDSLLADDITWELKGAGLDYTREFTGKAEVYSEFMGKLQAQLDPAQSKVTPIDVFVDEDQGAIVIHNRDALVTTKGARIDVDVAIIMRVRDGKIAALIEIMDLRPVEAAFGTSLDS